MSIVDDPRVRAELAEAPYPLLFVTVSGAHLYGFDSPDSDVDLRGAHVLPAERCLRLDPGEETVERGHVRDGLEVDLVTQDVKKLAQMLLRRSGSALEYVLSPLLVATSPGHARLCELARRSVTPLHANHYLGFARRRWEAFELEQTKRTKTLLYVYRVLATGIWLMRTGEVQASLPALHRELGLDFVPGLIEAKRSAGERAPLPDADLAFHGRHYARLMDELERARKASSLPVRPEVRAELDDLIVALRLAPESRPRHA